VNALAIVIEFAIGAYFVGVFAGWAAALIIKAPEVHTHRCGHKCRCAGEKAFECQACSRNRHIREGKA